MPLMMVWPLSGSVATRNEGSSVTSFCSAMPIFSWSPLALGSIACSMTGLGNSIFSSSAGFSGSDSVSPVRVSLRPASAMMSPAKASLDLLAVVGVHQVHAPDPLLLVAGGVGERHAALDLARVDAAERDAADVRVVHDLERQHRQRLGVERPAHRLLAGLHVDDVERLAVGRRGQIVDHGVEQRLHALVLEGRAAQHRIERARDRRLADQPLQRVDVGLLALEVGGHGVVVQLDRGLDHRRAVLGGLVGQVGRNLLLAELGALVLAVPDQGLHLEEVDTPLKLDSAPIGICSGTGLAPSFSLMSSTHW